MSSVNRILPLPRSAASHILILIKFSIATWWYRFFYRTPEVGGFSLNRFSVVILNKSGLIAQCDKPFEFVERYHLLKMHVTT